VIAIRQGVLGMTRADDDLAIDGHGHPPPAHLELLEQLRHAAGGGQAFGLAIHPECEGVPVSFALFFYNFSTFIGKPGIYLEGEMAARSEIDCFITLDGEVVVAGEEQMELIRIHVG